MKLSNAVYLVHVIQPAKGQAQRIRTLEAQKTKRDSTYWAYFTSLERALQNIWEASDAVILLQKPELPNQAKRGWGNAVEVRRTVLTSRTL